MLSIKRESTSTEFARRLLGLSFRLLIVVNVGTKAAHEKKITVKQTREKIGRPILQLSLLSDQRSCISFDRKF